MRTNGLIRAGIAAGLLTLAASAAATAAEVRVIASNPQGSIFYSASVTLGKILDEKLKMQVRVQPMGGSSTYIPLLNRGEVDFGLTNVDDSVKAYKGAGHFKRPNPDLRLAVALFPLTLGVIVPADSPVQKVADLKGKRMPSGYRSQVTGVVLQNAVLANGGLTMKDIRPVPAPSLFAGVDLLAEGKVDAATISIGTAQGQRAHAELASRGGIRFLNLDDSPAGIAAIRKYLPARPLKVMPAKNRIGIVGPTTVMAYTIFFTTNAKMPDDVVYNVVRTLSVSREEMMKGTPALAGFDPKRMTEEIGVPWHPGAIRFYREIGQWPPKD